MKTDTQLPPAPVAHSGYVEAREETARAAYYAMTLSLGIGIIMFMVKGYAFFATGSSAILSDAAESVVHNIAVVFAVYSLRVSLRPADKGHLYGHDRVSFFSAGFEGMMIVLAAVYIIYESVHRWLTGLEIQQIDLGLACTIFATVVNGVLGFYLIRRGKRHHLIVLEANGRHVLTDSWTSLGVIVALLLTKLTGWLPFDPILAIGVALNILGSGARLMRRSVGGLMDEADPEIDELLRKILSENAARFSLQYHQLRHRHSGNKLLVEFHLLFNDAVTLAEAHEQATVIEQQIRAASPMPTEVLSHLEPARDHDRVHSELLKNHRSENAPAS